MTDINYQIGDLLSESTVKNLLIRRMCIKKASEVEEAALVCKVCYILHSLPNNNRIYNNN